jgi:hypothetical protein
MPPVGYGTRQEFEWACALERWREFRDPSKWRYSAKGNLTREWDGRRVIVLASKTVPGTYQWCIAYGTGARFSDDTYESGEDAQTALGEVIGVVD